ncbi:MAG: hypothetical protein HY236_14815 [Acidobacteria bacterium]|nr:hypothetical protein [Acidobacteriota bacterium]
MLHWEGMLRFDQLVRAGMTIREIRLRFPETASVLEQYGFREACDDCRVEVVARRQGLSSLDVVDALNQAVLAARTQNSHNEV